MEELKRSNNTRSVKGNFFFTFFLTLHQKHRSCTFIRGEIDNAKPMASQFHLQTTRSCRQAQPNRRSTILTGRDHSSVGGRVDGRRNGLNFGAELFLDPVQIEAIIICDKIDSQAQVTKATRAANAMQVCL